MIFVKEKGEGNILHIKGLPQNVFLRQSFSLSTAKCRSYLGVFCDDRADDGTRNCSGIDAALRVSAPAAAIAAIPITAFTLVFTIPARAQNPDRGGTPGRPSSHDPGAQA